MKFKSLITYFRYIRSIYRHDYTYLDYCLFYSQANFSYEDYKHIEIQRDILLDVYKRKVGDIDLCAYLARTYNLQITKAECTIAIHDAIMEFFVDCKIKYPTLFKNRFLFDKCFRHVHQALDQFPDDNVILLDFLATVQENSILYSEQGMHRSNLSSLIYERNLWKIAEEERASNPLMYEAHHKMIQDLLTMDDKNSKA